MAPSVKTQQEHPCAKAKQIASHQTTPQYVLRLPFRRAGFLKPIEWGSSMAAIRIVNSIPAFAPLRALYTSLAFWQNRQTSRKCWESRSSTPGSAPGEMGYTNKPYSRLDPAVSVLLFSRIRDSVVRSRRIFLLILFLDYGHWRTALFLTIDFLFWALGLDRQPLS